MPKRSAPPDGLVAGAGVVVAVAGAEGFVDGFCCASVGGAAVFGVGLVVTGRVAVATRVVGGSVVERAAGLGPEAGFVTSGVGFAGCSSGLGDGGIGVAAIAGSVIAGAAVCAAGVLLCAHGPKRISSTTTSPMTMIAA